MFYGRGNKSSLQQMDRRPLVPILRPFFKIKKKSREYKEASVSSQQPPNLSEGGAAQGRFRKSDPENQYRFKKEDRIIYSRNATDGWSSRASNQANSLSIHFLKIQIYIKGGNTYIIPSLCL